MYEGGVSSILIVFYLKLFGFFLDGLDFYIVIEIFIKRIR